MSVMIEKDTSTQSGMKIMNNQIVTIFGGTGDLTYRKLLPAFYNLLKTDQLPEHFHIVIIGRQELSTQDYHDLLKPWLKEHARLKVSDEHLTKLLSYVTYFEMTFTQDEGYKRLKTKFEEIDPQAEIMYYFAVAPSFFETIAQQLEKFDLIENSKIIIEKPFGNDLASANSINKTLTHIFGEDNIYRIDHYIAKEMVQNIFTIRFANAIFSNIWDNELIDNIQISANEMVGVENRGSYYDHVGAIKDMFQNHLLQILSIVTMDEPKTMDAHHIHKQQEAILEAVKIENFDTDVVLGQYEANEDSLNYVDEDRVNPESKTETFGAIKLAIDTHKWKGVPIYVRTGKRMASRSTHIAIEFKQKGDAPRNVLVINVQPEEGVTFRFNIKTPGQTNDVKSVSMDFCQSCNYENRMNTPEAYERLLKAALASDHTLFASFKQVRLSWALVEEIASATKDKQPYLYKAYTNGPSEALALFERDGQEWIEEDTYRFES